MLKHGLNWETGQAYLLLGPALGIIALLFGGGFLIAVLQSVGGISPTGSGVLSLSAYGTVLGDPEFGRSLTLSLYLAGIGSGLSVLLSIGLALLLQGAGRWASFACQVTLPIPHLVGVVGILLLLTPSGFIARILFHLGWIASDQDFPLLVNDPGNLGVLIHFLWKEIPFATLILLSGLNGIGPSYQIQARVLGASPWQSFWHVTLPLLRPALLSASVLIFGFIFSSFEVPLLLGSTYPRTLPLQIYRAFTDVDLSQRSEAIALGIILAVLSTGIIAVFFWLGQREVRQ